MKDRVQGWITYIADEMSNGFNSSQLIEFAEEGYIDYLYDEYGKELYGELGDELLPVFSSTLKEEIISEAKKRIEAELEDYKTIALVLGVQHIHVPHKYFPSFKVLSEKQLDERGVKEILEKNGVSPHAWGVMANTNQWGNYWFIVLNKENYKEMIEDDLDVAIAILRSNYDVFED